MVDLPAEQPRDLPLARYARLCIEAEVNGVPLKAALLPTGRHWSAMLSKAVLRRAGLAASDGPTLAFGVADQEAFDVPRAAGGARRRRGHTHRVSPAKTTPTIAKRVGEVGDGVP